MKILVETNPTISTSVVLDEAGMTSERIAAARAVDRVLEGSELGLELDDEARTSLMGFSRALHDGIHDTSGGQNSGSHIFEDRSGLLENSIRLFAGLPDRKIAKLVPAEAHKRAEAAAMVAGMKHVFSEVEVPEDAPIKLQAVPPALPTTYEHIDWGDQYDWLYPSDADSPVIMYPALEQQYEIVAERHMAPDDTGAYEWPDVREALFMKMLDQGEAREHLPAA